MSVVGIGNDIVAINRLRDMPASSLAKLAHRVLTPEEHKRFELSKFPESFLAKRWAGKEAAVKALGTGIAEGVSFQHVHINRLSSGQPVLVFSDKALKVAQALGAQTFHISLSDEEEYATAFVVLSC